MIERTTTEHPLTDGTTVRLHRYPALQRLLKPAHVENRSLADDVGETLLARIVSGEYRPGMRLKTTLLASELGVSRTPVAKALARFSADGILEQTHNHMAVVAASAADWLRQVHALRVLLEPPAARMAAGNLPHDVVEDLVLLTNDSRPRPGDQWQAAALTLDFALHLSVAFACGNAPLATAIQNCWSYKRLSYSLADGCRSGLRREHREHAEILGALTEGQGERAERLMSEHLQASGDERPASRIV
ncbi:MAG: GntR family transcriptional regulator [Planctomycetales bacterium]|nr:GntR family transcriptional regulator [Planctomycetales bacterium]